MYGSGLRSLEVGIMATSESYLEYVVERLRVVGSVTTRKMFGGVGIYASEGICGLISSEDRFYLKVDDETREAYEIEGAEQFMTMPYFEVPEHVMEDDDTLADWFQAAVEVAARAKR